MNIEKRNLISFVSFVTFIQRYFKVLVILLQNKSYVTNNYTKAITFTAFYRFSTYF